MKLKNLGRAASILILIVGALAAYLLRGAFRSFEIATYPAPPPAFANWNDVLAHPRDISLTTLQTGVVHMDACLNLDPASPRQAECDHLPRDLGVLVHWIHHPHFGDFLIDTGFDDSFAKHPPYGNYTAAMSLFNWANGVTNRQEPGAYLINGATPVLLTGDASHFAWAFQNGVAPRGWDKAGTARGYVSLEQLRAFAKAYPNVKLIYGHEAGHF